jgi:hypothetical protein
VQPPVHERRLLVGRRGRDAQPGQDFEPGLPGKGAVQQQVSERFRRLVGEEAARVVLQAVASQPLSSPTAVLVGQPVEEFDPWWRPALPN